MKKHDNQLAISIMAALIAAIALIYTLIVFPQYIFAVIGLSIVFLVTAFIVVQNLIAFSMMKTKSFNIQLQNCADQISGQMNSINESQSQLAKMTFLYTKKSAKSMATLENNYTESQDALFKNIASISDAQAKSTKLLIKYDQNNTGKLVSALKDVRDSINETIISGLDHSQPDNTEIVATLEEIVNYLKSQPANIDQTMGLQLNNVAHELQNISNSIQRAQIPLANMQPMQMAPIAPQPVVAPVATAGMETTPETAETADTPVMEDAVANTDIEATEDTLTAENTETVEEAIATTDVGTAEEAVTAADAETAGDTLIGLSQEDLEGIFAEMPEETAEEPTPEPVEEVVEEPTPEPVAEAVEEPVEEVAEAPAVTPVSDDPNKQLSADEIAALFAAADPAPKKEEKAPEPVEEVAEAPAVTPVSDDPNKQLSADEIAALFAAADPAPKKEEPKEEEAFTPTFTVVGKEEPEPMAVAPVSDDPNKQLSADEIAALFAAAEPAPKKEEKAPEPVAVTPVSDDPNKQLSPDEIAALFASMG